MSKARMTSRKGAAGMFAVVLSLTSASYGQAGHALRFDGVDSFVSIENNGDFNFDPNFTVEAWVKPTSLVSTGDFRAIVRGAFADGLGGGLAWGMTLRNSDPSNWGLTVSTPSTDTARSGPGGLEVGQWQHLAGTYDGSRMRIYRDGTLVTSMLHPDPGTPSDAPFIIIGLWGAAFRGYIDEVRIWNTVRTGREIATYMNCSFEGNEYGLVGNWSMNEGSGQWTHDSAGYDSRGRLGSVSSPDSQDPAWVVSDAPIHCFIPNSAKFRRGDVNQDSREDLSDAIAILNVLFGGVGTIDCLDAADTDDDGSVNLTDSLMILSLLFSSRIAALPAPYRGCGYDPTGDRLGCESYEGVCPRLVIDLDPVGPIGPIEH
jgi:hypothetical protein